MENLHSGGLDLLDEFRLYAHGQWSAPRGLSLDENKIVIACDDPSAVEKIRFAWRDNVRAWLYNEEGLPASPFEVAV